HPHIHLRPSLRRHHIRLRPPANHPHIHRHRPRKIPLQRLRIRPPAHLLNQPRQLEHRRPSPRKIHTGMRRHTAHRQLPLPRPLAARLVSQPLRRLPYVKPPAPSRQPPPPRPRN